MCELLIQAGANIKHRVDNLYMTPLCLAVRYNHPDIIKLLLNNGADKDKQTGYPRNDSPLILATKLGYTGLYILC